MSPRTGIGLGALVATAVAVWIAAASTTGSTASPPAARSGAGDAVEFTGEVKPVLYVRDVEVSAPFYRDVLGFELLGYTDMDGEPYYAEMAAGSLKFGLHDPVNEEQETWVGHQRLYFRVLDVLEHRARVLEHGADAGELVETDWMDFVIVRDPDGHQIVFAETDPARHPVDPW